MKGNSTAYWVGFVGLAVALVWATGFWPYSAQVADWAVLIAVVSTGVIFTTRLRDVNWEDADVVAYENRNATVQTTKASATAN